MLKKIPKKKQQEFHRKWIKKIIKDETDLTIKRHIIRHAREVFKKDPELWSASMRNLIDIFDAFYNINPPVSIKLARLYKKYNKNKRRYTSPPP